MNGFFILLLSIVLASISHLLFKSRINESAVLMEPINLQWLLTLIFSIKFLLAFFCLLSSFALWILALRVLPISVAMPFTSLVLVFTVCGGILIFNEKISYFLIFGVLMIVTGLILTALHARL